MKDFKENLTPKKSAIYPFYGFVFWVFRGTLTLIFFLRGIGGDKRRKQEKVKMEKYKKIKKD
ncbi:MAG: hypothetical protein ACP5JO_01890 [Candidatus Ratteibacteria bacterium]